MSQAPSRRKRRRRSSIKVETSVKLNDWFYVKEFTDGYYYVRKSDGKKFNTALAIGFGHSLLTYRELGLLQKRINKIGLIGE